MLRRPGVDGLLQHLGATGLYEIVLLTATSKEYVDVVVDTMLDSFLAIATGLHEIGIISCLSFILVFNGLLTSRSYNQTTALYAE
jgi:hypothetical protein